MFMQARNAATKLVSQDRKAHLEAQMSGGTKMWKVVGKVVKPTVQASLKAIQQNGKVVRKPAEIANAAKH